MMSDNEIRRRLAPLQGVKAPPGFTERVVAACAAEPRSTGVPGRPAFMRGVSLGLAAVLAVVLFATHALSPAPSNTASPEELREARRELAWTLTLTTRVLDRSGSHTLHSIFAEKIPDAIQLSLQRTLEPNPKGKS